MRIAILTLPLHTNYGGILQAFALYNILLKLGHQPYLITDNKRFDRNCLVKPLIYSGRLVKKILLNKKIEIFYEKKKIDTLIQTGIHTNIFIKNNFKNTIDILDKRELNKFDAIIVGSDQIWRPKYYPKIEKAYLSFIKTKNIKKIAYAPSFGTDTWEYTSKQTKKCKELLSSFDKISVREDSAVKLVKEKFDKEAYHTLDPTLLMEARDYKNLVNDKNEIHKNKISTYILDKNKEKLEIIDLIKKKLDLDDRKLNAPTEDENLKISERIAPPLEDWINGFMDTSFVITDSFHACVFSIIFNKPFIAIANKNRGITRFVSLLTMFNLKERLINNVSDMHNIHDLKKIDWEKVNKKLKQMKHESISFIENSLL